VGGLHLYGQPFFAFLKMAVVSTGKVSRWEILIIERLYFFGGFILILWLGDRKGIVPIGVIVRH